MKLAIRIVLAVVALAAVAAGVIFLPGQYALWRLVPTRADVAYGAQSPSQKLDLYRPAGVTKPVPVVVFIHGGAFMFGDKREPMEGFVNGVHRLNAAGIALASIDYRMSGEARFPAAVRDARSAVRYLRAHAAELGIDPDRIALWGKSAGANLALMAAVAPAGTQFDDPAIAPGTSGAVSAVISMYAPTDFLMMDTQLRAGPCGASAATHDDAASPESLYVGAKITGAQDLARAASPIHHVRAGLPPMLVEAGTMDCTVPAQQSQTFAEAMTKAGNRVTLHLLPGARHGDDAFETADHQAAVIAFLKAAW